jgi:hypothetical protein
MGVTMNTGLYRIEFARLAASGGLFSGRMDRAAAGYSKVVLSRSGFIGLALVLIAGLGGWLLLSGGGAPTPGDEPLRLAAVAPPSPAEAPSPQDGLLLNPEAVPEDTAAVDGLKISSQSWRRGGLGSNALVTFTLRNRNDYAVKDIEISCAFSRSDGSHLTDRTRVIHDTVKMRSRKTFARVHIGFVNINADRARCALVNASHA